MRTLFSKNTWHFKEQFDHGVDCALWLLERTGLHIPPFDQHPAPPVNPPLTVWDAEEWKAWLHSWLAGDPVHNAQRVSTEMQEQPTITTYMQAAANLRKMRVEQPRADILRLASSRGNWQAMNRARGDLPPVTFYLTAYPYEVIYAAPPQSVILGFAGAAPQPDTYPDILLEGIRRLLAAR